MGYGSKSNKIINVDVTGEVDSRIQERVKGQVGKSVQTFAGVIRNTGTGWGYIDDIGHAPVNMDAISLYNGSINVHHTPNALKVGTLIATPDETYANDGLICGASVGTTNSYIHLHFPLNVAIDGNGNLTLPSYFSSSVTGYLSSDKSQVVIDHPPVSASDIPQVISPTNNRENADYSVSYTDTQVIVTLLKNMSGHIYYDSTSSSFKYIGSNIDDFSFSFDNVTGELTVAHANITGNDVYSISITGRDGYYTPKLSVPLTNSFKVKFYDDAGNLITTPDSNMRFYFSRPNIRYKSPMQAANEILIKRGHCKADANDVVNSGANIWINGLMEM
ncbi:hypothetical protein [Halobacillus aidingensis]|uniref:Uncharacterized protein n=1 Tax=Halobacillus aidingensis TaxID=240303 RepID=A0A1H0MFQ7_HALAD|nr:hypothetical protein [Halobacillus aidingensis]SDO78970.1 hypothetical protein SAMN05421677_10815 [Halobacillus aidingensis]